MPDCLEMPYQPAVRNAETMEPDAVKRAAPEENVYRLGGNSCLSGDYMGAWRFGHPLAPGDRIIFEDMIHYTCLLYTSGHQTLHIIILPRHQMAASQIEPFQSGQPSPELLLYMLQSAVSYTHLSG